MKRKEGGKEYITVGQLVERFLVIGSVAGCETKTNELKDAKTLLRAERLRGLNILQFGYEKLEIPLTNMSYL